ncbi:hypothetical protein AMK59_519 [Oryctes borbonicus]|uniref:Insect cuticle protein n=1 Tax=Oryctes borbonicus TaxID=1629725 RepID=A0A0T6BAX3_9SCAR|nr:hypothetical protein AMK59_519 [Oryctes borbonicus]
MDYLHVKVLLFLGIYCSAIESVSYTGDDKDGYNQGNVYGYYGSRPNKKEQKYYQDIYVAQLEPKEVEFGHVKETPYSWEQRFEKINLDQNRQQGKAKWNDPRNGYGEFYYDFNNHDDGHEGKKGKGEEIQEGKKQTLDDILADGRKLLEKGEVEFIDGKSYDSLSNGQQGYHGGNYKAEPASGNQPNAITNERYKAYKY